MEAKLILFLIFGLLVPSLVHGAATVWAQKETDLRTSLTTGYDRLSRPDMANTVLLSLHLISMNYLEIKDQTLSVTGYITLVWDDSRLDWSTDPTYNFIREIYTLEQYVWRPTIIIENSVDNIDVISTPNTPITIKRTGTLILRAGGIINTACQSDVTYWPLDSQTCEIVASAWSYNTNYLNFNIGDKNMHLEFYEEHGEWELVDASYNLTESDRATESFSQVIFTLKLKRRPLFHMLNTLFPVVLMGFLTVIVFKLNPESGERVGLSLTILLAYAVYLTLISESIPTTSTSASLLSTYLASILLLQTMAVFLTVVYLDIFYTPEDEPVPRWLNVFARYILATLTCAHCSSRNKSRVSPEVTEIAEHDEENRTTTSASDVKIMKRFQINDDDTTERTDSVNDDTQLYSWKEIALMLDKVTMYFYLVIITGGSVSLLGVLGNNYLTA